MLWIKRNLFLVVGGVLAVGLILFGGYYFWTSYDENKSVESKLDESKAELKRLTDLVPSANKENIDHARAELQRIQTAINQTKTSFTPLPYDKVKGQVFKTNLDTAIDELQKRAERASVALPQPKGYAFTFAEQQKRLQFSEGSFPTLAEQLGEIKAICQILFDAKVNKLTGLRRGRVTSDDPAGGNDYHELPPNRILPSGATGSPYALEFNAFSAELATVLEGFYKSPNGLLVKAIEVKPMDDKAEIPGAPPPIVPLAPAPAPVPGNPALPPRRNLLPPPPGTTGVPRPAPPGARTRPSGAPPAGLAAGEGMQTVLDEKKLRITLWVDVLKPPAK